MPQTKGQSIEEVNDAILKNVGSPARSTLDTIFDKLNTNTDAPLRMSATFPTADAYLNFSASQITEGDGGSKVAPPVSQVIYDSIIATTINFQTQALSNATYFTITWPGTNNVGQCRRVAFTLVAGKIKATFSNEAASVGALTNAGALFDSSGSPIGYIDLICTSTSGYFKTAGSATNIIENANIHRLSAGAGGGGAPVVIPSSTNPFETYLAMRLDESYFQYATPVVFETSAALQVASSTATLNTSTNTYDFSAGAQSLTSVQMFNTGFLALADEARQIELHADWYDLSSYDSAAVYETSLNGGLNWQTVTMAQVPYSTKFLGRLNMNTPTAASLFTQATNNSIKEITTSTQHALGQKITLTGKNGITQIQISLTKTGTPSGSFIVSLLTNNAGSPGTVLYSTITLCSTLSAGANAITISGFKNILPAGDYWITVDADATYNASFVSGSASIAVGVNTALSGYAYNGTTWSTLAASGMYYVLSGHVYDLRFRVTSSASGKKLKAVGILFDEQLGTVDNSIKSQNLAPLQQSFSFSGDTNVYQFTVTAFMPDSRQLKVYDITAGQVYVYPAFAIDGRNVTFPTGTFTSAGATIALLFDQSQAYGYDYSDMNSSLLTDNHLGSQTAANDKSIAGRGIILRRPDGTLRELAIDNNDAITISTVP